MKSSMVFIYALSDPRRPHLIRYIGKTATSLAKRLTTHIYDALSAMNKRGNTRRLWIKNLITEGLKPKIWTLEICDESNWPDREKYWIKLFRPLGILNATDGGDQGFEGGRHSEKTKALYRTQRAGRRPHVNNILKTIARNKLGLSPEIRAKISKTLTGRKRSDAATQKLYAHPNYPVVKEKLRLANLKRMRPVICVDNGTKYPSIRQAARSIGCNMGHLRNAILASWKVRGLKFQFQ